MQQHELLTLATEQGEWHAARARRSWVPDDAAIAHQARMAWRKEGDPSGKEPCPPAFLARFRQAFRAHLGEHAYGPPVALSAPTPTPAAVAFTAPKAEIQTGEAPMDTTESGMELAPFTATSAEQQKGYDYGLRKGKLGDGPISHAEVAPLGGPDFETGAMAGFLHGMRHRTLLESTYGGRLALKRQGAK